MTSPGPRLSAIDGLRAIAILAVIACHASLIPHPAIGTRGIDLFFVISGLCLSLPFLRKGEGAKPYAFWSGRFWRIAPPYWVALAIFVALSFTSFGTPSIVGKAVPFELPLDIFFITGVQPIYNGSFWTLGVEARWYIFFPALLALYMRSKLGFAALALALYLWDLLTPYRLIDVAVLPCFMLGIVAADLALRERVNHKLLPALAVTVVTIAILVDKSDFHGDPLWHLAAFLTVLAGLGAGAKVLSWKPLAFIGIASYSIYLMHQPFIIWFGNSLAFSPLLAAALSIVIGIAFWALIEVPSLALRERIRKRGSAAPIASATPGAAAVS